MFNYRNIMISAILTGIILFLPSFNAFSGDCNCVGGESSEWNPYPGDTLGCNFFIHYEYCEDETPPSIKITEIEFISGCSSTTTKSAIINEAVRRMLSISSGLFQIESPALGWTVNIEIEAGWQFNMAGTKLVPCTSSDCCSRNYDLRVRNGWVEATDQEVDESATGGGTGSCDIMCNSLQVPEDESLVYIQPRDVCLGDCPNVSFEWAANQFVDLSEANNCTLRTYYLERECDNEYEFMIDYIEVWDNSGSLTSGQILNKAIRSCLAFFGADQGTPLSVTLITTSCWELITTPGVLEWCNYDDCCITTYNLSTSSGDIVCVSPQPHTDPNEDCNGDDCNDLCSSHTVPYNTPLPKRAAGYQPSITVEGSSVISIIPNPAEGKALVHLEAGEEGNAEIAIFDATGSRILRAEINKDNYILDWQFETKGLRSGIYFCRITVDGKVIEETKFIVKK